MNRLRRTSTAAAAGILTMVIASSAAAVPPEERGLGSHIIIGVEAGTAFDVTVAGEPLPENPVVSSADGIVTFQVDDAGLPPGPHTIFVSAVGGLIIGGIHADGITTSSAIIHWSTNLASDSRVDYGLTDSYGMMTPTDPNLTTQHAVTLTGLSPGEAYHFRVFSDAGGGESAVSGDNEFATTSDPLVISDVTIGDVSTTWATVTWQTNRASDSQIIFGETIFYGQATSIDPAMVTNHSVTIAGLDPDTSYHFRVRSEDASGEITYSADGVFRTALAPLTVTDVAAVVTVTSVEVTWQTSRPADSQIEYGSDDSYGTVSPLVPAMVIDHTVTVAGLDPGTTYHYRVRSEDAFGEVVYSDDRVFETTLAPLTVTDVTATVTVTSVEVTWTTNRAADSQIEYGPDASYGTISPLASALVLDHSVTIAGLDPGATYHYRVRSEDGSGETVFSGDHTFDAGFDPLEISGLAVTGIGINWAVIEWTTNRPADARSYFGLTSDYGDSIIAGDGLSEAHACTLTGLAEATVYHFQVVSRDEHGIIAASADSTLETMQGVPLMPPIMGEVTLRQQSVMSVVVSWTTDVPASSEVMYGAGGALTETSGANATLVLEHEVLISPLIPNVEYTFCALSESPGGTGSSDPCTFTTGPPIGIQSNGKPAVIIRPRVWTTLETEARIRWSTDRPCSTWVAYGIDSNYGSIAVASGLGTRRYEVTLLPLEPDSEYHYRISAWDEYGGVSIGDDRTFRTAAPPDIDPPAAPEGASCVEWNGGITVSWLPNSEEDLAGYFIYRVRFDPAGGDGFGRTEKLNENALTDTLFYDSNVEPGGGYGYYTTAMDTAGNESGASDAASIVLAPEPLPAVQFTRYPNPTFDSATLSFSIPGPDHSDVTLRIISIDGRAVRELTRGSYAPGSYSIVWDGEDGRGDFASSGIYLCELTVDNMIRREKLTLIR